MGWRTKKEFTLWRKSEREREKREASTRRREVRPQTCERKKSLGTRKIKAKYFGRYYLLSVIISLASQSSSSSLTLCFASNYFLAHTQWAHIPPSRFSRREHASSSSKKKGIPREADGMTIICGAALEQFKFSLRRKEANLIENLSNWWKREGGKFMKCWRRVHVSSSSRECASCNSHCIQQTLFEEDFLTSKMFSSQNFGLERTKLRKSRKVEEVEHCVEKIRSSLFIHFGWFKEKTFKALFDQLRADLAY